MKKLYLYIAAALMLVALFIGCGQKAGPDITGHSQLKTPAGNYTGVISPEDLKDKTIGVSVGSGSDILLTGNHDYTLLRYDTAIDALLGLKNDSVSAIAVEITTAREMLKNNDGISVIRGDIGYENYGIAVAKNNNELKNKLDVFIDYQKTTGAYDNLVNRWIKTGAEAVAMPDYPVNPGNVLRVGIDATYTPFEYYGENNELLGFDIEFMYQFAKFYGLQLEFFNSAFSSLFTALDAGQVDMVISAIAITNDRQERYTFSEIYYANEIVFVVKTPENKQGITNLSELSGKSIGVLSGTTQDAVIENGLQDSLLFYYDDDLAELKSLRAKRVDAVAASDFNAEMLSQYNEDLTKLPENLECGQVAFATSNNKAELAPKINAAIAQLITDGTTERLHERWFTTENTVKEDSTVALTGENGTIRFGVVPENNPYAYKYHTRIIGLDIDLMRLVAEKLGMKVEIVELEPGQAVTALQTGKVDVIGGGLLTTDKDAKSVSFSTPYDTAHLSLVVWQNPANQSAGFWTGLSRSFYNNIIKEERYKLIWQGLWETVIISLLSILAGTLVGALFCAMKRSKNRILKLVSDVYVKIMQGIPVLVLLLIVCYVFFANVSFSQTAIAVIAFSAYFAAYVCEILNSGLNSVDKGQREAAIALGYTRIQAFFKHILPQTVTQALPIYRGECISLIKNTSIVGFIAILDLTKASDIIRSRTYEAFFPLILVAIIYFVIAWAMTYGLKVLEKRLDIKQRRRSVPV